MTTVLRILPDDAGIDYFCRWLYAFPDKIDPEFLRGSVLYRVLSDFVSGDAAAFAIIRDGRQCGMMWAERSAPEEWVAHSCVLPGADTPREAREAVRQLRERESVARIRARVPTENRGARALAFRAGFSRTGEDGPYTVMERAF